MRHDSLRMPSSLPGAGLTPVPCAGFLDHEFYKHASCYGNYFTANSTAFFEAAVSYAAELTAPGSAGAAIAAHAGHNISFADLAALLNGTASPQCNRRCQLSEVWNCLVRPRPLCQCRLSEAWECQCAPGLCVI